MQSEIPEVGKCADPVFAETCGRGEDVVLVHGWGMHGGFWKEFARELALSYRVTSLDLPGHGHSAPIGDYSAENMAMLLSGSAPKSAHWIGWSLGATLVLVLSGLFPDRVKSLTLVAGNPKFSKAPDWPHALEKEILDVFYRNLIGDFGPSLFRFLKIQTLGLDSPRERYRALKERLNERAVPHPEALSSGVEILKHADYRERLRSLRIPVLALFGTKDSLVPVGVSGSLQKLNPSIECCIIPEAGHMPFFTHREKCLAEVFRFLGRSRVGADA
jgi:pimeloyl-[acyl-carrier protein] methyl ester esterase